MSAPALEHLQGFPQIEEIDVAGVRLSVRRNTHDLETATSCLSGEFDLLGTLFKKTLFNFIIDAGGYIGTAAIALARMFPSLDFHGEESA